MPKDSRPREAWPSESTPSESVPRELAPREDSAGEHPALAALRALANRAAGIGRPGDLWPVRQADQAGQADQTGPAGQAGQESAKEAAVLLLMGVLDDAPAHNARCTTVAADLDLLVLVRSGTLRHHAGQPALPGGRIDPEDYDQAQSSGRTVEQVAALREAVEETGLQAEGVRLLGQLPALDVPVSNYRVTPVLGWWESPTPVEAVDQNESTLVVRVPVADLLNPANRLTVTVRRGSPQHQSPAFRVTGDHEPFTIWGFTGYLLSRVFEELGWEEPWD